MSALITSTVFNQKLLNFPGWGLHGWRKKAQPDRGKRQSSLCGVRLLILSVCTHVPTCVHACWCKTLICFCVYRRRHNPLYQSCPWQFKKWILSASTAFSTTIIPLSQPGCINVNHTRQQLLLIDEHIWCSISGWAIGCRCEAVWSSAQIRACSFIKQFQSKKIKRKALLIWKEAVISLKAAIMQYG